jgi:hypothetical protein
MGSVTEDPPADVLAVLAQLFAEGQEALADGEVDTAREAVTSTEEVASNKLPEGDLRGQLLHGCAQARALLDPETGGGSAEGDGPEGMDRVEPDAAAAEYLAAMERRLPEGAGGE